MRKATIHELRERELRSLIARNPELGTAHAKKLMNSFYRLCGLSWSNLEYDNDETRYNAKQSRLREERENRWYDRLNGDFKKAYGLQLKYCGCMPAIGLVDKASGAFTEVIERHFYD